MLAGHSNPSAETAESHYTSGVCLPPDGQLPSDERREACERSIHALDDDHHNFTIRPRSDL